MGEEIHRQYRNIHDYYNLLVKLQTKTQKGLPREKQFFGDEKCTIEEMLSIIKQRIIEPNEQDPKDLLIHTKRQHTNVLKGGNTDAKLIYFNMKIFLELNN